MSSIADFPQIVNSGNPVLTKSPSRDVPTPRTLANPNQIPLELWSYRQFVCWRYQHSPNRPKPDKIPVNPKTLGNAGVGWPNTWSSFHTALATYAAQSHLSGVGFVLTAGDPFAMIDLDNCLFDGEPSPLASEAVSTLGTYAEVSPSGRGLRLFVRCQTPCTYKGAVLEIYSATRFATLTGNVFAGNPIATIDSLDWLIELVRPVGATKQNVRKATPYAHFAISADDDQVWVNVFSRNRLAYQIMHGDLSDVDKFVPANPEKTEAKPGHDNSRAVMLLLNSLAAATGRDAVRMERMIRQCTKLDQTKFDRPWGSTTWLRKNIEKVIGVTRQ